MFLTFLAWWNFLSIYENVFVFDVPFFALSVCMSRRCLGDIWFLADFNTFCYYIYGGPIHVLIFNRLNFNSIIAFIDIIVIAHIIFLVRHGWYWELLYMTGVDQISNVKHCLSLCVCFSKILLLYKTAIMFWNIGHKNCYTF